MRNRASGGKTKWIAGAIKHPGALHRALHVPQGEKIPAKKMAKAAHSENPRLRRMATLAKTLKGMHRKADGGGIDESIDVRSPEERSGHVYPYGLGQAMQYEKAARDTKEVNEGKRFFDTGTRIPGQQKARNDAYYARLKSRKP